MIVYIFVIKKKKSKQRFLVNKLATQIMSILGIIIFGFLINLYTIERRKEVAQFYKI